MIIIIIYNFIEIIMKSGLLTIKPNLKQKCFSKNRACRLRDLNGYADVLPTKLDYLTLIQANFF